MKKLSDYRIREFNGKFAVETKIETEEGFFRKRIKTRWVNIWTGGCQEGLVNRACAFDTLEEAKAKIVELCEDPTYHYLFYKDDRIDTMNVPVSEYLKRFKYKMFPPVILEINQRRISPADILYSAVRDEIIAKSVDDLKDARDTIFINEALKINPLFYKLVEKYEEMKQKRGAEKK